MPKRATRIRVNTLSGLRALFGLGPKISAAAESEPDGLLLQENFLFGLRQFGMRQYWRDFEALEKWSRSEPHRFGWQRFPPDSGGTGFWNETYFRRGGVEAVYMDVESPIGMMRFAPLVPAKAAMFSARTRAGLADQRLLPEPVTEPEFYSG